MWMYLGYRVWAMAVAQRVPKEEEIMLRKRPEILSGSAAMVVPQQ